MKKILSLFLLSLLCASAMAQTGGISAKVVNRAGRQAVGGSTVSVLKDGVKVAEVKSDEAGSFLIKGLADGQYSLEVSAEGFLTNRLNARVENGLVKDLMLVSLTQSEKVSEVDDSNFAEQDLMDTGYSDSPTILFTSNDPYNNIAGFGFSTIRFKERGYNSETQEILLAGVPMNDAITGYSSYNLWSGLNEATRSKESTYGLSSSDVSAGGINGVTNILGTPGAMRTGWRVSALTNSAYYRARIMASYSSGRLDNGWVFSANASLRFGGNDWVQGVFYKSASLYLGAEKRFNSAHNLAFFAFAAPGERGAQNASTQEVYNLMGDNMYNSNWGYQNGKVRNSRVRRTFEPVVVAKYDFTPSDAFSASATLLWRTGKNGYTALDWYDAQDPRPDYYRNLPSYFSMANEDYDKNSEEKAAYATEMWNPKVSAYRDYQHVNWDRMYNVNYFNFDSKYSADQRRSKYVQEQRHVDQNDINVAGSARWNVYQGVVLNGGVNFKINRSENYKKIADLLGGDYYVNADQYAERDNGSNEALMQNDLDYFLKNGKSPMVGKNDKYGYDYLAQIRKGRLWGNVNITNGGFAFTESVYFGYDRFWREGLVRKGLFAGLDDNGKEIVYGGKVLTTYDSNGQAITSKGKSEVKSFLVGGAKAAVSYTFKGGHRVLLNAGAFSDAPTFNQSFVSPRTRNSIMDGLTTKKTLSADLNYQFSNNGYNVRVTGFYTKIMDQSKVMSFYDDSQHSYTNFAMTGIDERHVGGELGFRIPLPLNGLSIGGAVSYGEYVYTSNPKMVQTVDNSSEVVRNSNVPYWSSHPIYKTYVEDGKTVYEKDLSGNYVTVGEQKHYVPSTPQLASELALNYRTKSYWFFEVNGQYFAKSYLDMNPLYRTQFAVEGPDGKATAEEITYMCSQEEFSPVFLLNFSIGKSWYIQRKYNIGFNINANNVLNNRSVKTGGYEQTRLLSSKEKDHYLKFDSKYFYMPGMNYMLNIYFRF